MPVAKELYRIGDKRQEKLRKKNDLTLFIRLLLIIIFCLCLNIGLIPQASAESLSERLKTYPNWQNFPTLNHHQGEINYPNGFEGTWQVISILVEQIAPFAPTLVTPSFEGNRRYLEKPLNFKVKFQLQSVIPSYSWAIPSLFKVSAAIIADRRYNAEQITRAYLGESGILAVKLTQKPSPRLVTIFPQQRRLISTVISYDQRLTETDHFLTSELTHQQFEDKNNRYFNQVETTTDYRLISPTKIEAQQITAIYLSPQDPNYFSVQNRPVALYRYQLSLIKKDQS